MARWMKDHTTAATNPKDPSRASSTRSDVIWSRDRHRYHQRDLFIWSTGLIIVLSTIGLLLPRGSKSSQLANSAKLSPETRQGSSMRALPDDQEEPEAADVLSSPKPPMSDRQIEGEKETALMWWVDSGILPAKTSLASCLSRPEQAPIEVLDGENGYTVITPGRPQPQTIYLRQRQVWFKTPALSSPHVQAYDHLALASCLKTPEATLYDPMLVRQWDLEEWPSRNPRSGGFPLDDLFVIRSKESAHYTYGLSRVGLPELGLYSSSTDAREALRHLALAWLIKPKSRETLRQRIPEVTVKEVPLELRDASEVELWLGPLEVKVATGREGDPLSDLEVKKLARAKAQAASVRKKQRRRARDSSKSKSRSKSRAKRRKRKATPAKKRRDKSEKRKGLLKYQ